MLQLFVPCHFETTQRKPHRFDRYYLGPFPTCLATIPSVSSFHPTHLCIHSQFVAHHLVLHRPVQCESVAPPLVSIGKANGRHFGLVPQRAYSGIPCRRVVDYLDPKYPLNAPYAAYTRARNPNTNCPYSKIGQTHSVWNSNDENQDTGQ